MNKLVVLATTCLLAIVACDNQRGSQQNPLEPGLSGVESPQEGLAAIITLHRTRNFETLIRERYAEIWKAESEDQVMQLIERYESRWGSDAVLGEILDTFELIDPASAVITERPDPQPTETGEVATFAMGDQEFRLYMQKTGKWGYHL